MRDLFAFRAPVYEMGDFGTVLLDRPMVEQLRDGLDEWLEKPPILELVLCVHGKVYAIVGACVCKE